MALYEVALAFTLVNEGINGEYTDSDFGGPTRWGITLGALKDWRKTKVSAQDVRVLSKEEAALIYKTKYWDLMRLSEVKDQALASIIFDQGVNSGPLTVIKMIQQILKVTVDGILGSETLGALNSTDPVRFGIQFYKARQAFYTRLAQERPADRKHLKGWMNRTHRLLDLIMEGRNSPIDIATNDGEEAERIAESIDLETMEA